MVPDRILDLKTGRQLTSSQLMDRLAAAQVVFIGEYHEHQTAHRHQLEIIEALHQRHPRLAIGLEVFDRTQQEWLDDWVGGRTPESVFQTKTQGAILSTETYAVYFPILDWARRNQVPLLALNAPRRITAKVAEQGLVGLTADDRPYVASEIIVGPPEYKKRVMVALEAHSGHHAPDNFFAAQTVWDETMAETLADYLRSPSNHEVTVVVICGNEHVYRGYGLPDRLRRRIQIRQISLLMPQVGDHYDLSAEAADVAWTLTPEKPPGRPRLGVDLAETAKGLEVVKVVADSEAQRIGLLPGDRLVNLDGHPLRSPRDLHQAALAEGLDRAHVLTVDRQGRELKFTFRFRRQ